MKFNKEKTKKFASGGKSPKEIMEEARRNQAIERSQATADVVRNSGIPAFQSQQVSINVPRPTVALTTPDSTQRTDLKSMFKTRGEAFNYARKQGWTDFNWGGGRFHTKTAGEVSGATSQTTPSDDVQDLVTKIPTETSTETSVTVNPQWGTYGQFSRTAPRSTAPATPATPATSTATPAATAASAPAPATQSSSTWWERFNENNTERRERARNRSSRGVPEVLQRVGNVTNKLSMRYQQGGQIPSYQSGAPIYRRNLWERFWNIKPKAQPVLDSGNESTRTYRDGNVDKYEIIKDVPYGVLTSTREIKYPGTTRPDTLYRRPDGEEFKSKDIKKNPSLQSYPDKFNRYFKYQQGGKVEAPTDEMYVDFAVRYLSALGVGETEMVDEEGGLREEYAEAVTVALQEIDSPEFWEHYHSNPDEAVGAYVESKQSPEQVEMARKGAKLKKLQKLKKGTAKKCKCGCDLTMKKEKGGTITEVCSCGCKAK